MSKKNYTLVGHRGFPEEYPENTLEGISAALELGAKGIEIDLQISSSGVPIVTHDDTLSRLAREDGLVSDYTCAELKEFSVHEPERFGDKYKPTTMPTLNQVVGLLAQYKDAKLFVEIKQEIFNTVTRVDALDRIWDLLLPIKQQVMIISYDLDVLRLVQQLSLCPVGWVVDDYTDHYYNQIKSNPVDIVISNYKRLPPLGEPLWKGPWQWFVYDVVDQQTFDECLLKGVYWIETWDVRKAMTFGAKVK